MDKQKNNWRTATIILGVIAIVLIIYGQYQDNIAKDNQKIAVERINLLLNAISENVGINPGDKIYIDDFKNNKSATLIVFNQNN